MLKPLTRDFWPDSVQRPYFRLAMGFLLGPIPLLALFAAATLYFAEFFGLPRLQALLVVFWFCLGVYTVIFTLGALVAALLWALRLRFWGFWMLAGAPTLPLGGEALIRIIGGQSMGYQLALALAVMGALIFLCIWLIAGLRAPRKTPVLIAAPERFD